MFLLGILSSFAQYNIQYIGAVPESGSTVNSFDNIELEFDLAEVVEGLGGDGEWGISYNATYNSKLPSKEKSAALYKGTVENGEVIARLATRHTATEPGNKIILSFDGIEIESGQEYTILITYEVFANNVVQSGSSETLVLKENPIVLTYYGGNESVKVLNVESCNYLDKQQEIIKDVQVSFNYPVSLSENAFAELLEDGQVIKTTSEISILEGDNQSINILFPETQCYLNHKYVIRIPESMIAILGESIFNNEISVGFEGLSYLYFGIGRGLTPSEGSVSILDEITVPFKFPTSETKTYGLKDTGLSMTVYVYAGENTEGDELLRVEGNASTDGTSLVITPNYAFEPESEYTFIIPEGTIEVYDLGARNPTIQKEFKNERIVLHYATPTVESLPAWNPSPLFIKNNDELSELKYYIIDCPDYEYDGTIYSTITADKYDITDNGALYLITENGEEEIKTFRITKKSLDSESEIGNGELDGSYFVGEVNEMLYEGNKYKVVWREHDSIVNNPFIGKYIGNPEVSVMLNGTTPTSDDFGLTANIDDRLHSHADVFSFVTESEVKAGENAKMILKDGEENIAEAPVYVSREANGHRVYADFGGKKLESGKCYDVVLPEGSVYAANGIVNNPEIKSAITAMPEAPVAPEFVSIALNIDEYASATYRMAKGQESVLNLKAGDDWKLESLSLNGKDVTGDVDENGLYTLPALDEDANLDAAYKYAHEINYDYETGVGNIQDVPYSLSKDGSHLLISGLKGGERIAIYTAGGMKIASLDAVPADMHEASLALPEGQVYVILINGTSIKWKH